MEFQRKLRNLLLLASLLIFCYQMKVALNHLFSNATVDSTEFIPVSEVTPPIITFCPRQQVDAQQLNELGYASRIGNTYSTYNLLAGKGYQMMKRNF